MNQFPSDPTNERAGTAEISVSDRHRLLADERRRVALAVLAGKPTPVALEVLARAVATREADGAAPPAAVIEEVAITLHHHHLPFMTDVGVVEYDPETRRIESVRTTPQHHWR